MTPLRQKHSAHERLQANKGYRPKRKFPDGSAKHLIKTVCLWPGVHFAADTRQKKTARDSGATAPSTINALFSCPKILFYLRHRAVTVWIKQSRSWLSTEWKPYIFPAVSPHGTPEPSQAEKLLEDRWQRRMLLLRTHSKTNRCVPSGTLTPGIHFWQTLKRQQQPLPLINSMNKLLRELGIYITTDGDRILHEEL